MVVNSTRDYSGWTADVRASNSVAGLHSSIFDSTHIPNKSSPAWRAYRTHSFLAASNMPFSSRRAQLRFVCPMLLFVMFSPSRSTRTNTRLQVLCIYDHILKSGSNLRMLPLVLRLLSVPRDSFHALRSTIFVLCTNL